MVPLSKTILRSQAVPFLNVLVIIPTSSQVYPEPAAFGYEMLNCLCLACHLTLGDHCTIATSWLFQCRPDRSTPEHPVDC